jgi:hypothetical protein
VLEAMLFGFHNSKSVSVVAATGLTGKAD